ncbi:MAG: hypothetical protein LOY03_18300 [Cyclobacteriaceae bacterium]|nr:hypothetical protein [Cyclobacteriaceae bacterium]
MERSLIFFDLWDAVMRSCAYVALATSIALIVYYEIKVSTIKDLKEKYDYINLHEIRYFWSAIVMLIVASGLFVNSIGTITIARDSMLWFYVRIFATVSLSIIAYFVFFGMIRVYYPGNVEKRLKRLRETPRISPSGNTMRKLSEAEEDAHLDPGQIEDEAIHSIDYDVWIDDTTGFTRIEKYYNYQHAEACPECGYYTMKIEEEEIQVMPTATDRGLLHQHYHCSYCEHREVHAVRLAATSRDILEPAYSRNA